MGCSTIGQAKDSVGEVFWFWFDNTGDFIASGLFPTRIGQPYPEEGDAVGAVYGGELTGAINICEGGHYYFTPHGPTDQWGEVEWYEGERPAWCVEPPKVVP